MNPNQRKGFPSAFTTPSRRDVLRALCGTGLGLGSPHLLDAEAKKKRRNKRKPKKRQAPPLPPTSGSSPPDLRTRVDATCAGLEESSGGDTDGNARVAQTFTALSSGVLVTVQLPIFKKEGSVGDFILRLAPIDDSGVPTNGVLAETTVASADVPGCSCQLGEESAVTFRFGAPAAVDAGTQYALVLTRPGSDYLNWGAALDNPCTGRAFHSPDQTAPFAALAGESGFDFSFMTFVRS